MSRMPAVAGRFYDADPVKLQQDLRDLLPAKKVKIAAKLLIVPHAGYVYSGRIAGTVFTHVEIPETVVLLGPNHHNVGAPLAVSTEDWETPLGTVPLAADLATMIVKKSALFTPDDLGHEQEHSLEVQLPFLQMLQPKKLQIVPICVSRLSLQQCREAGAELAKAIKKFAKPVLMIASTDMTHYEPRHQASEKDQLALGDMLSLDPAALYRTVLTKRITMCGVMPVSIALFAALALGAEQADLLCCTDSGYVNDDTERVVGYAGLTVH